MNRPNDPLRFAGDVTYLSRHTKSALRKAVVKPNSRADEFPHKLTIGEWQYAETCRATIAEVAYVRWIDIARAAAHPYEATIFARAIQAHGFNAIAFDADDSAAIELVLELLSSTLLHRSFLHALMRCLDGHVYLVPSVAWLPACADSIYSDIRAQTVQSRNAGTVSEWKCCAERAWLNSQLGESASQ
jgi:hypothetical protein